MEVFQVQYPEWVWLELQVWWKIRLHPQVASACRPPTVDALALCQSYGYHRPLIPYTGSVRGDRNDPLTLFPLQMKRKGQGIVKGLVPLVGVTNLMDRHPYKVVDFVRVLMSQRPEWTMWHLESRNHCVL